MNPLWMLLRVLFGLWCVAVVWHACACRLLCTGVPPWLVLRGACLWLLQFTACFLPL